MTIWWHVTIAVQLAINFAINELTQASCEALAKSTLSHTVALAALAGMKGFDPVKRYKAKTPMAHMSVPTADTASPLLPNHPLASSGVTKDIEKPVCKGWLAYIPTIDCAQSDCLALNCSHSLFRLCTLATMLSPL